MHYAELLSRPDTLSKTECWNKLVFSGSNEGFWCVDFKYIIFFWSIVALCGSVHFLDDVSLLFVCVAE